MLLVQIQSFCHLDFPLFLSPPLILCHVHAVIMKTQELSISAISFKNYYYLLLCGQQLSTLTGFVCI